MTDQLYPSISHPYCFELNKEVVFSAAHFIPHDDAGKCRRVHGHNYTVNITVAGDKLDDSGFLVNFQTLKKLVQDRFDHFLLNDLDDFSNTNPDRFPTTEGMAFVIWQIIEGHLESLTHKPRCLQVLVRETPTSYAFYRPKMEGRPEGRP